MIDLSFAQICQNGAAPPSKPRLLRRKRPGGAFCLGWCHFSL